MPNTIKLGFVGLNCTDVERMTQHYTEVIGLPKVLDAGSDSYFSCGDDHHALILNKSGGTGLTYIGLQIEGQGSLDDVAQELRSAGVQSTLKSDLFAGIPQCIEITDPDGYVVYLYRDIAVTKKPYSNVGISPQKLGHVALFCNNAKRSDEYYSGLLNFRCSDWIQDLFVFLRCNSDHHSVNFLQRATPGMFHFALECADSAHLIKACDELGQRKIKIDWGPGRHGPGHNLYTYHHDPDGNIVELFAEIDRMSNEILGYFDPRPYHRDSPQRPTVWKFGPDIDIWGPPIPKEFRVE